MLRVLCSAATPALHVQHSNVPCPTSCALHSDLPAVLRRALHCPPCPFPAPCLDMPCLCLCTVSCRVCNAGTSLSQACSAFVVRVWHRALQSLPCANSTQHPALPACAYIAASSCLARPAVGPDARPRLVECHAESQPYAARTSTALQAHLAQPAPTTPFCLSALCGSVCLLPLDSLKALRSVSTALPVHPSCCRMHAQGPLLPSLMLRCSLCMSCVLYPL